MEKRIVSFDNGIAVIEEINTFSINRADVEKLEQELNQMEQEAIQRRDDAIRVLQEIVSRRENLKEAQMIIYQAEELFEQPIVEQVEQPIAEEVTLTPDNNFQGE